MTDEKMKNLYEVVEHNKDQRWWMSIYTRIYATHRIHIIEYK